jgi:hypothetical protein
MKVDAASLAYIQNVVKTAQLAKIGNIIIEPTKVRAIDDEKSVVLFQDVDVPDMPFNSIGLNRIDVFMTRFEIAKSVDDFTLEAVMPDADPEKPDANKFARALVMKGKGIQIDYRCANPQTIQAPKTINDAVKYKVAMNPEAVLLMSKGQTAMTADEVSLISDKEGVHFEMTDINGDAFTHAFADKVTLVDKKAKGDDTNFTHKYPLKVLLPLFKVSSDMPFHITSRGMLKIVVNGLDMYVLPRA